MTLSRGQVYQRSEHEYIPPTKPEALARHEWFVPPVEWTEFLEEVELRTGRDAADIGFLALAMDWMTADEQDRGEAILTALLAIEEARPRLDIWRHLFIRTRRADIREGRYWRCRREGTLKQFYRRRQLQRRADALALQAREVAA